MSIYSGFATRAQQECYDQCIDSLLYVFQRRIIKFYKNQDADQQKFISLVLKIHQQLRSMENNKYLEPKTSHSITQLIKLMQVHQKNTGFEKNKTNQIDMMQPATHKPLPAVDSRHNIDGGGAKKKQSMWVQKNAKKEGMIDQEMQTMGTIYEKKDSNSPKQSNVSRRTSQRQTISALKTKYNDRFMPPRPAHKDTDLPTYGKALQNRSHSHHLAAHDHYHPQVRNHLKQIQQTHKRRRRSKMNKKLGLIDLNTEEDNSQYQVGDIIREYVSRVKRKVEQSDNKSHNKGIIKGMNDF